MKSITEKQVQPAHDLPDGSQIKSTAGKRVDKMLILACAGSFAVALLACLFQNLTRASLESCWVYDSGHYLISCQQVADAWRQLAHNPNAQTLSSVCSQLKTNLLIDGPVLPSLGAVLLIITNKSSAVTDPKLLIILQGVLHSVSAAILCLLSRRLTGSSATALATGVIWALYPPAVLGAAKFLTETLASVLVLGILFGLSRFNINNPERTSGLPLASGFAVGFLTAGVMLSKPALTYAILPLNLFSICSLKSMRAKALVAAVVIAGTILPIIPWAAFTKANTGRIAVMNERMPTFNIVNGLDLETDGGGYLCKAPFALMFRDNEDSLPTALGLFCASPAQTINLVLRKIPRLVADPWNDFYMKFFGATIPVQRDWHQFLMLSGVCGILAFLSSIKVGRADSDESSAGSDATFIGLASIFLIAGHFIYLLVMTTPRYEFTAAPLLVLFAGFALKKICFASKTPLPALLLAAVIAIIIAIVRTDFTPFTALICDTSAQIKLLEGFVKAALLLAGMAALYALVRRTNSNRQIGLVGNLSFALIGVFFTSVLLAFATNDASITEWTCQLPAGAAAHRSISLKVEKPTWAMVIFDSDATSKDASISVNGHDSMRKSGSLYLYTGDGSEIATLQLFSSLVRTGPEKMRQWRAVPVAVSDLNLSGNNDISIASSPAHEMTLYGSYPPNDGTRIKIPSLRAARFLSSSEKIEGRMPDPKTIETAGSSNWYIAGSVKDGSDLAPEPGKQSGQYHVFLVLGYETSNSLSAAGGRRDAPAGTALLNKVLVSGSAVAGLQKFTIDLPEETRSPNLIHIELTGEQRCAGGITTVATAIVIKVSGKVDSYYLEETPALMQTTPAWTKFKISGDFPCSALPPGKESMEISVIPNRPDVQIQNLAVSATASSDPNFRGHKVALY